MTISINRYLYTVTTLKNEFYLDSACKDTELFDFVDRLLKGVEVELPEPYSFIDKDGKERHHIRVKWWDNMGASYRELSFGNGVERESFPIDSVSGDADISFYETENKPVFFGHYWMSGKPRLQQDNVCCVDYSAGKGEKLVCYRFENPGHNSRIDRSNFIWADTV